VFSAHTQFPTEAREGQVLTTARLESASLNGLCLGVKCFSTVVSSLPTVEMSVASVTRSQPQSENTKWKT
jgi:hypothetical protein